VWIARAMLLANNDEFGAEALVNLSHQARSSAELDQALGGASANRPPGDFGVEFVGAVLPALLIEFGRLLWDAYTKSLAEQGGKALATITIDKIKQLARHTWSRPGAVISLADAETRLRQAASHAGLDAAQTDRLVQSSITAICAMVSVPPVQPAWPLHSEFPGDPARTLSQTGSESQYQTRASACPGSGQIAGRHRLVRQHDLRGQSRSLRTVALVPGVVCPAGCAAL
jgi:hypothetical protein